MANEKISIVFTKGRAQLMSLARRLLGSSYDAEDALQDAFCRLWPLAGRFETEDDARRVAAVTVRNVCIDQLRETEQHPSQEIDDATVDAQQMGDQEAADNAREQYAAVNAIIIRQLSPLQQRLLRRHDVEGCPYERLAIEERMTEAALRQQLSRARKTVRECYRAMTQPQPPTTKYPT